MSYVSISHDAGLPYVRIDNLPLEDQAGFSAWIIRQTRPVVPSELDTTGNHAACAYAWDYAAWLANSKPAAFADSYAT